MYLHSPFWRTWPQPSNIFFLKVDKQNETEVKRLKAKRKQSTMISSSECITWFAVFVIEGVVTVTVNLLTIIILIKNRSLRTRAMYFVINLTVADMLVGGISSFGFSLLLVVECEIMYIMIISTFTEIGYVARSFFTLWFHLASLTNWLL